MRILWISNIKPALANSGTAQSQSGGWIDGAICEYSESDNLLGVAYVGTKEASFQSEFENVSFYEVPIGGLLRGKRDLSSVSKWKKIIRAFNPDVIQIWGTEYSTGLDVMDAAGDIPVVVYIQGVVSAIAAQGFANIPPRVMAKPFDVLSLLRAEKFRFQLAQLDKQREIESEIIARCSGVISDNEWCFSQYRSIRSDLPCFYHTLPLKKEFVSGGCWSEESCSDFRIFTIAGRGPLKGIHDVIRAVSLVKKSYPDVRLVIPGDMTSRKPSFLYKNAYMDFLEEEIRRHDLDANVDFCGRLTAAEMANEMRRCNLFVMPSCIENHSSTLREAMSLGAPVVSSNAGSSFELIIEGVNGHIYRYGDVPMLAGHIIKVISDKDHAALIGKAARRDLLTFMGKNAGSATMDSIYETVVEARYGK